MHAAERKTWLLPGTDKAAWSCSEGCQQPGGAVLTMSLCTSPASIPALTQVKGTRARSARGENTDLQLRKHSLYFQHHLCLLMIPYKTLGSVPQFPCL